MRHARNWLGVRTCIEPESVEMIYLHRTQRGATLIELTIVLVLVSAMSAIAILRAGRFIDAIEVRGAATEIQSLFSLGRHAAIARGAQSTLSIDPGRGVFSLFVRGEPIATREVGETHGVRITSGRTSMTWSPTGLGYGAANFTMTVARGSIVDTIVVSRLGRVRH